jgi:hypothetical protein
MKMPEMKGQGPPRDPAPLTAASSSILIRLQPRSAFGLTAAPKLAVAIGDGRLVQHGLHDYPLLTLREMPKIEVHIVLSDRDPSGAGDACGRVFAATGDQIRRLPVQADALRAAMLEGEKLETSDLLIHINSSARHRVHVP